MYATNLESKAFLGDHGARGVAALPLLLILSGIIMEIAIASTFIIFFLLESGLGERVALEGLAAARSGIYEAAQKIVRNKNFYTPSTLTVTIGDRRSVDVSVCNNAPCVGERIIEAVGVATRKQRKLEAILNIDEATGEVRIASLKEVPL